jgi:hypothetical protein
MMAVVLYSTGLPASLVLSGVIVASVVALSVGGSRRVQGLFLACGIAVAAVAVEKPAQPQPQSPYVICKYMPWLPECIIIPPSAAQQDR